MQRIARCCHQPIRLPTLTVETSPLQVIFINSKYDAKKADVWSCGERCSGSFFSFAPRVQHGDGKVEAARTSSLHAQRLGMLQEVVWRPPTHHNSRTTSASAPAGIILYAMVYGYYPFNPADPKLPKKMMEASAGAVGWR